MDHVEAEGDTIDEAIANALKILGVERDLATIDILSEGRKGVLGIGARKARVRALLRSGAGDDEETARERAAAPSATPEEVAEAAERGRQVLAEILRLMGLEAAVAIKRGDFPEEVILAIEGDYGGLLIDRGGQALEALQYLVTRIVSGARGRTGVQIEIDAEGYRERRRKGLEDMALRLGEKAKRQRKTVTVDPLSVADRRVVEAALEDDPWLTTKSIGSGAYRRLLIIPEGDRKKKDGPKPPAGRQPPKEEK
jgi:spoIIIJ-associated protein